MIIEDVTLLLLNFEGRFFILILFLANWAWHILSPGFSATVDDPDLYSLNIILSRFVMSRCIYVI